MEKTGTKNRGKLWSGVIAVFIAGMIVGGLTATILVRNHVIHVMREGPPRTPERIAERLTEDLALGADQRAEVGRIVRDFEPRFTEFEQRSRAEVRSIADEMRNQIRTTLTPEQQVKFDASVEKMRLERERRDRERHRR